MAILALFSCDHAKLKATDHLHVLGYKNVTCIREEHGTALCAADQVRFRCVVLNDDGCNTAGSIACERYDEKAAQ